MMRLRLLNRVITLTGGSSLIPRYIFVFIGLAAVLAVGLGLSLLGLTYVNIDNLKAHPITFILLFVSAPAVGFLSLITAAVPRVVQVNILLFVGLWICVEFAFGLIDSRVPGIHGDPVGINRQYYLHDPVLGYRPAPDSIARHTEFFGTERVYSVTYLIDRFGRRDTRVSGQHPRDRFLLFFGDSNTFGEGLTETETLPYWAGQLARDYYPYNYAFSGWGPAQMLDLLKTRDLKTQLEQKEGYAIFFFIHGHIGRVIGSSEVSTDWGEHFPYYTLDTNGDLGRHGNFATGRPLTTLWYYLLTSSNIIKYFRLELPLYYSDADYRLAAEIMKQSQNLLEKKFKLQGFYVVISPAFEESEARINHRFILALQTVGVTYLDFTHLYDTREVRYRLDKKDYHNSALANRVIAGEIVKDLGIGGSNINPATGPSPGKEAGASPAQNEERKLQR